MTAQKSSPQLEPVGVGSKVGAYRIERLIGSGGMADVFYAVHEELHRPSAIKILKTSLASEETNLQRFMQEARAAASLVHPNIVQVYDVGRDQDRHYLAQEYVAGTNLRQYLATHAEGQTVDTDTGDRQLGLPQTLSILLQVLAALSKAAGSGIVHRDIKPENIMLTPEGEVKVADFGLARSLLGDDPKLTRVGTTLGTPMYMSPEQIQDGEVDVRSDLYSLGVTLFHMLSGRPPYSGDTPLALAMQHVQAPIPDVRDWRSDIPMSLSNLLLRLLAKKPEQRFSGPVAVLDYLREHRQADLASVWPEHTVPLPDASAPVDPKLLRATMELQNKLGSSPKRRSSRWLMWAGALCLLFVAFYGGTATSFSIPFELFDESSLPDVYKGVPRQDSAEEQYRFALVTEQAAFSRVDKWAAVNYYFPKEANEVNRVWAAMASIQLSRAMRRKGDMDDARQVLTATAGDKQMPPVYRAYAYLELAVLEESLAGPESSDRVQALVSEALGIFQGLQRKEDQELLRSLVQAMPMAISGPWFEAQN